MIGDMWESFTWAMRNIVVQVWEFVTDSWHDQPLATLGVVITIAVALFVIFRPAR